MIYAIKAIPTRYAGVQFRSRLEARWAAFFDKIGWSWEYEPFDLDGWTPDFSIKQVDGERVLIEVKPFEFYDWPVRPDGQHKAITSTYAKALPYCNEAPVLLLGIGPFEGVTTKSHGARLLGMIAEEDLTGTASFHSAIIVTEKAAGGEFGIARAKTNRFDALIQKTLVTKTAVNQKIGRDIKKRVWSMPKTKVDKLWIDAANEVQWIPKNR